MYDPEMRKDCPMRGNLWNCSPVGGFCIDAVSDEICEAVHNAYDHGFCNALKTLKEQEAVKPKSKVRHGENAQYQHFCGNCMVMLHGKPKYCSNCGMKVKWE